MLSRLRLLRLAGLGERLHTGETSLNFTGRRTLWYTLSAVILLAAVLGLTLRGLHLGVEFKGGSLYTVTKPGLTVSQVQQSADHATGSHTATVQSTSGDKIRIQIAAPTTEGPTTEQTASRLAGELNVPRDHIDVQHVGPSWGKQISDKAAKGLAIFMVLVTVYLAIAFEWRMALAALAALIHDLLITVGIYALIGFEVTPGTVIGFLTILGYSLYDTVVVFDGVKDATRGLVKQTTRTYSQAANHALNQTLIRSLNTTVLALLPVAALLFIGGGLLGAGTLTDIALALFIGLAAGAYSSICVATPLLAQLKERQPAYKELAHRVTAHRANPAGAGAGAGAGLVAREAS